VQAQVAKVTAIFAVIGGVLGFFTAGWWGGFMDRYGRTRIMGVVIFSSLLNDFLTLLVFFYPNKIPGGYWILIITPFVEGFLGTPSTPAAAETTYMRDVSEPHDLSRNFALLVGVFHTGGTIGPVISGFLSERTGTVITVLYATTILHIIYASIAWFALPESVSEASMIHARNQYANELASATDVHAGPFRRRLLVFTKAFWHSFPLHVLTPMRLPNSRWKRDYNLVLLALSAGLINVIMASAGEVYQYGLYTFKWSSLQVRRTWSFPWHG
jgi:MFS family permease